MLIPRPQLRKVIAALAAAALVGLAASTPADAHSFLIRSDPAAGARLAKTPGALTLYFSEPFVRASEDVSLRRVGGDTLELAQPTSSAATVRQPLPARLRGVYVVHWRVLSDDGHISLGEFAFAVGSNAALPTVKSSTTRTSWSEVSASWFVFIGLALALGGLLSERFVWRLRSEARVRAAPVFAGVALASAGALLQLVLLASDRRGGGFGAGLSGAAIGDAAATRPGKLTIALLISLLVAAALAASRRLRLAATVPLLAAVGFIATRGHSGTSGHGWAVVVDIVHLAAVAIWLGALAHLVLAVVRNGDRRSLLAEGGRRYAGFALPTVMLIIATGIATAIPEFRSVGAVFTTGYGRTLLIKAALIAVALLLALAARQRALPANPHPRMPLLQRLTVAEATVLAAVLVVVAVLVNAAPPRGPTAAAAPPTAQLGPPPVAGPSLQLADLAGQLGVAVTAGAKELQFTVIPPGSQEPGELKLTAEAKRPDGRAVDLYPRPCGSTCFTIRLRLKPGTTIVRAQVASSAWRGGSVTFSIPWPLPRERPDLLRRVATAMRTVRTLTLSEAVTSGPGSATPPVSYRLSGRAFMKTEVFAGGAVDVRPLRRTHGQTQIAFALPGSILWYRIWIDRRFRLRRELIVSPGHLIRRTFSYRASGAAARTAPSTPAAPSASGTSAVTPPPPGAVVLGREDGDLAVGLAVRQVARGLELQTTVLGADGGGLGGLDISYRARGSVGEQTVEATPCGTGCYRARLSRAGSPRTVAVEISGGGRSPSAVMFAMPAPWPAPAGARLVADATRTFRGLKTLVIHERLASNPSSVVRTTYQVAAPDRLAYQIKGGSQAIVVGNRRWDSSPGGDWRESTQSPLHQPTPAWRAWRNAHVIGRRLVGGRAVSLVSFYDPTIPAFFTIAIDRATKRTIELRMTAAAHFMHHRYSAFNAPTPISPPRD